MTGTRSTHLHLALALATASTAACASEPAQAPAESLPTEALAAQLPFALLAGEPLLVDDDANSGGGQGWATRPAAVTRRSLRKPAVVRVPRSGYPFVVTDVASGASVAVRALDHGSDGARFERSGAVAVARDDAGRPRTILQATSEGLEDWVRIDEGDAEPVLRFEIEVAHVVGLRLVGRTLELLDALGVPRLRASPPRVVDALGAQRTATLDVAGCDVDRSAAPPWRRVPVAPGARSCVVEVRWDARGLVHPLWVDPYWSTTGSLAQPRANHQAVTLTDGSVLVAGGASHGDFLLECERFDPASETWAATGSLPEPYWGLPPLTALADGRALLTSGRLADGTLNGRTREYGGVSGEWSDLGVLKAPRRDHSATLLADGRVLIAGGETATMIRTQAEILDPVTGKSRLIEPMASGRANHQAARLPDGRVAVVGGRIGLDEVTRECELYRPDEAEGSWETMGRLVQASAFSALTVLPDGTLLLAGGREGDDQTPTVIAQRWLPADNEWRLAAQSVAALAEAPAFVRSGDLAVLAGGEGAFVKQETAGVFGYSAADDRWVELPPLSQGRRSHAVVQLANGGALAIGGVAQAGPLSSVESLHDSLDIGAPCDSADQCAGGICADGVCCDSACTGDCFACTAYAKVAGADGVCGEARACSATCESNVDCGAGMVCSAERRCVPSEERTANGGGCALVDGARGAGVGPLISALAALAASARRRGGRRTRGR